MIVCCVGVERERTDLWLAGRRCSAANSNLRALPYPLHCTLPHRQPYNPYPFVSVCVSFPVLLLFCIALRKYTVSPLFAARAERSGQAAAFLRSDLEQSTVIQVHKANSKQAHNHSDRCADGMRRAKGYPTRQQRTQEVHNSKRRRASSRGKGRGQGTTGQKQWHLQEHMHSCRAHLAPHVAPPSGSCRCPAAMLPPLFPSPFPRIVHAAAHVALHSLRCPLLCCVIRHRALLIFRLLLFFVLLLLPPSPLLPARHVRAFFVRCCFAGCRVQISPPVLVACQSSVPSVHRAHSSSPSSPPCR